MKQQLAPEPYLTAGLRISHHALVYIRNLTHNPDCDLKMINDLAEAAHDIPMMLLHWNDTRPEELRKHLACFSKEKYPEGPNLLKRFEVLLKEAES